MSSRRLSLACETAGDVFANRGDQVLRPATNLLLADADVKVIKAETMQGRVHQQLRELLMLGRFHPGQALKIYDLAQLFGTSVQPVRESIRQLVTERALEALPNRSARVPHPTKDRLRDLWRTRLALEGLAAEMATEACTPEEIATLTALCKAEDEADRAGQVDLSVQLNLQFHMTLYAAAGSPTLLPFIESLWLQIGPLVRHCAESFDARQGEGALLHWQTVSALEKRDAAATRAAIEADITRTLDLVLSHPDFQA